MDVMEKLNNYCALLQKTMHESESERTMIENKIQTCNEAYSLLTKHIIQYLSGKAPDNDHSALLQVCNMLAPFIDKDPQVEVAHGNLVALQNALVGEVI